MYVVLPAIFRFVLKYGRRWAVVLAAMSLALPVAEAAASPFKGLLVTRYVPCFIGGILAYSAVNAKRRIPWSLWPLVIAGLGVPYCIGSQPILADWLVFARWLRDNGRLPEAAANLRIAVLQNPSHIDSQYMLMQTDADLVDSDDLRATAQRVLALFPGDSVAAGWLARAASLRPTPEAYLNQSLAAYQAGKYGECIAAAQKALELRPTYSEAWNNIAAAWNAQGKWDDGIHAGQEAVRLNPHNQLAINNLAWARSQKQKSQPAH
jgi:tetratricopeptide (TPR) repeat protein